MDTPLFTHESRSRMFVENVKRVKQFLTVTWTI